MDKKLQAVSQAGQDTSLWRSSLLLQDPARAFENPSSQSELGVSIPEVEGGDHQEGRKGVKGGELLPEVFTELRALATQNTA